MVEYRHLDLVPKKDSVAEDMCYIAVQTDEGGEIAKLCRIPAKEFPAGRVIVADLFETGRTYEAGDYYLRDGQLFRVGEADPVSIGGELSRLDLLAESNKKRLDNLIPSIGEMITGTAGKQYEESELLIKGVLESVGHGLRVYTPVLCRVTAQIQQGDSIVIGTNCETTNIIDVLAEKYVKPADGIPGSDIKTGAIGTAQLADDAVTGDKVDDEAIAFKHTASNIRRTIARNYDNTKTYKAGDYAFYTNNSGNVLLVRALVDITIPEDYDSTKWQSVNNNGVDSITTDIQRRIKRDEALAAIYATYPTETQKNKTAFRTLLGADSVPVKSATVTMPETETQTSASVPQSWIIRRCGKNLFDADTCVFRKAAYINASTGLIEVNSSSSSDSAACETYIPVVPGARIVSQGIKSTVANIWYRLAFYDRTKAFISPIKYSASINNDFNVTAPDNAYFMRFCCFNSAIPAGSTKMPASRNVQFEILDDPAATVDDKTDYEAYNGEDTTVTVTALDTPTDPAVLPTTVLGQNIVTLFPQGALADVDPTTAIDTISVTATMDVTHRLDPTLAYDQLRAAIVASGAM